MLCSPEICVASASPPFSFDKSPVIFFCFFFHWPFIIFVNCWNSFSVEKALFFLLFDFFFFFCQATWKKLLVHSVTQSLINIIIFKDLLVLEWHNMGDGPGAESCGVKDLGALPEDWSCRSSENHKLLHVFMANHMGQNAHLLWCTDIWNYLCTLYSVNIHNLVS